METKGLVIIWGALALFIAAIIAGIAISGAIGDGLLVVGVYGVSAWVCFVLWLMSAMNSDI